MCVQAVDASDLFRFNSLHYFQKHEVEHQHHNIQLSTAHKEPGDIYVNVYITGHQRKLVLSTEVLIAALDFSF